MRCIRHSEDVLSHYNKLQRQKKLQQRRERASNNNQRRKSTDGNDSVTTSDTNNGSESLIDIKNELNNRCTRRSKFAKSVAVRPRSWKRKNMAISLYKPSASSLTRYEKVSLIIDTYPNNVNVFA